MKLTIEISAGTEANLVQEASDNASRQIRAFLAANDVPVNNFGQNVLRGIIAHAITDALGEGIGDPKPKPRPKHQGN